LKILCPRERRVFQSKLGVSSSKQCNLHHSPHTGHLEKKNKKKGTIFFGHGVVKLMMQCKCLVTSENSLNLVLARAPHVSQGGELKELGGECNHFCESNHTASLWARGFR
jgi:hypothetical protein